VPGFRRNDSKTGKVTFYETVKLETSNLSQILYAVGAASSRDIGQQNCFAAVIVNEVKWGRPQCRSEFGERLCGELQFFKRCG
jgi:hypothetical protein